MANNAIIRAGGDITVQRDDSVISSSSSILNFEGPNILVTNDGGGKTTIVVSDRNAWETIQSDSGSTAADTVDDTLTIAGGSGITTSISGDTLTIINNAPNQDQNIWATIQGDMGSTSADSTADTLTVAGSNGIETGVSGDTLTITGVRKSISSRHNGNSTQTFGTTEITLEFSNVITEDSTNYSYSSGEITITTAGLYLISYDISCDQTTGTRQEGEYVIQVNNVDVAGSFAYSYHRNAAVSSDTGSARLYIDLLSNDVVRIRAVATGTITTKVNSCRLNLELVEAS